MKFYKLLKGSLFSAALLGCGMMHGHNNFCPNCGYCLNLEAFHQRFDMPPPSMPCRCCLTKGCPCVKNCDKNIKECKGCKWLLRKNQKDVVNEPDETLSSKE